MLCQIVIFNDDSFSLWVFFAGFVLVYAALMSLQDLFPHGETAGRRDLALLVLNGLLVGAGVSANLVFESVGVDLYVVALLALLAPGLLWCRGAQPLHVYYTTAYSLGLIGTALSFVIT